MGETFVIFVNLTLDTGSLILTTSLEHPRGARLEEGISRHTKV
jgi:hypothetical protein